MEGEGVKQSALGLDNNLMELMNSFNFHLFYNGWENARPLSKEIKLGTKEIWSRIGKSVGYECKQEGMQKIGDTLARTVNLQTKLSNIE